METLTSQNPTPRIETQPPLNSNNKRAISEVISETSPTFDHRGNIVEPFDNEAKRDLEFQESEYMRVVTQALLTRKLCRTQHDAHRIDAGVPRLVYLPPFSRN